MIIPTPTNSQIATAREEDDNLLFIMAAKVTPQMKWLISQGTETKNHGFTVAARIN